MASTFGGDSAQFVLELAIKGFVQSIKTAGRIFDAFASKTAGGIKSLSGKFGEYVADLSLEQLKSAFEGSLEYVANFASESKALVELADSARLPVEVLSKLQAVSKGADVDLQYLANAANALSFDALSESAVELGLSIDDLKNKDKADVFASVADALARLPDESARATLALKLFGESAEDLKSIFDGAAGSSQELIEAAESAGLIASDENARNAAAFAETLEELKASATGLGNALGVLLLPLLQEGAELLQEFTSVAMKFIPASASAASGLEAAAVAASKAREEAERLRALDAGNFSFVADLAGQGTLTVDVFEKAASTVEELEKKYGELGFEVDAATRSITMAADAQEKFNAAANEQRLADLDAEIAAAEANVKGLDAQEKEKVDFYNSAMGATAGTMRNIASAVSFGAIKDSNEKWDSELTELRDKRAAENKRLQELKAERDKLTGVQVEGAPSSETPSSSDAPSSETPSGSGAPSSGNSAPPPARSQEPSRAEVALSNDIDRFVNQRRRASQSETTNEIEDVRNEEAEFRAKVDERISQERSKGKSGEDAELIANLERLKEESTTREAERVDAIKKERQERVDAIGWEEKPVEGEESKDGEKKEDSEKKEEIAPELQATFERLEESAKAYEDALKAAKDAATTDEERAEIDAKIAAIPDELEKRKNDAKDEFNVAQQEKALEEQARLAEKYQKENELDPEYFERSYQTAEETAKGTSATFSAFDASQQAVASVGERSLKEAERQTRILEDLREYMRNGLGATFA